MGRFRWCLAYKVAEQGLPSATRARVQCRKDRLGGLQVSHGRRYVLTIEALECLKTRQRYYSRPAGMTIKAIEDILNALCGQDLEYVGTLYS